MSGSSLLVCWIAAALVAVAPLPFASVDPLPSALLESAARPACALCRCAIPC